MSVTDNSDLIGAAGCIGFFGSMFGHNYQARYDEKSYLPEDHINASCESVVAVLENMRTDEKIYVHDVCVRCGHVIRREKTDGS